ncbi:MAG: pitrilysin family protein [Deltaproteobacteria bacterium]|nr:pitrilysin family protein [Deltaproteobacteria bacterium]
MKIKFKTISMILFISVLILFNFPPSVLSYDLEKKVILSTLENGMKVLMLERHMSPTVSFYIRHRVGSVDEENGKTGTAHLLEHLLFKGTKTVGTKNYEIEEKVLKQIARTGYLLDFEIMKGNQADRKQIELLKIQLDELNKEHKKWMVENEIDRIYTENGAVDINASTGRDLTTYHVSLPSNKIELWARIEADRMTNPVLREFYAERNVVKEERNQRVESDPGGKLFEQFLAAAFIAHPYRHPILGWSSDLNFINMDDTENFFKKYHAPDNTVIAVVGDIAPVKTLEIIKKYFGPIPRQNITRTHVTEEPLQTGERRIEVIFDATPHIVIGYHKPNMPAFDDYVFDVMEAILSKGRTSRLYKALVRDKGLAETVQTVNGMPGSRYPNLFVLYAIPRPPRTNAELEAAIYSEIDRLKTEPVSEKELEKIKNQLKADFIRGLDSNAGLASTLSYFETQAGDYRYFIHHINVIEKITSEDIIRVARRYLTSDNRTVACLVKKRQ